MISGTPIYGWRENGPCSPKVCHGLQRTENVCSALGRRLVELIDFGRRPPANGIIGLRVGMSVDVLDTATSRKL